MCIRDSYYTCVRVCVCGTVLEEEKLGLLQHLGYYYTCVRVCVCGTVLEEEKLGLLQHLGHYYMCVSVCVCGTVLEEEKLGLQKEVSDLRGSVSEVEAARLEARRHWQELRHNLKSVENERNLLTDKVNELQLNLAQAGDKLEDFRKENFAMKQKVAFSWLFLSACSQ